jgi:hypothetical protein
MTMMNLEPHPFDLWFDTPPQKIRDDEEPEHRRSPDRIMLFWGMGLAAGAGLGWVFSAWVSPGTGEWTYAGMGAGLIMSMIMETLFRPGPHS